MADIAFPFDFCMADRGSDSVHIEVCFLVLWSNPCMAFALDAWHTLETTELNLVTNNLTSKIERENTFCHLGVKLTTILKWVSQETAKEFCSFFVKVAVRKNRVWRSICNCSFFKVKLYLFHDDFVIYLVVILYMRRRKRRIIVCGTVWWTEIHLWRFPVL